MNVTSDQSAVVDAPTRESLAIQKKVSSPATSGGWFEVDLHGTDALTILTKAYRSAHDLLRSNVVPVLEDNRDLVVDMCERLEELRQPGQLLHTPVRQRIFMRLNGPDQYFLVDDANFNETKYRKRVHAFSAELGTNYCLKQFAAPYTPHVGREDADLGEREIRDEVAKALQHFHREIADGRAFSPTDDGVDVWKYDLHLEKRPY